MGPLFTYSANCNSKSNYLHSCGTFLAVPTARQIRHLPQTTSSDSSALGEVLRLMQCMRAGVKSEQIFILVPFDLSADQRMVFIRCVPEQVRPPSATDAVDTAEPASVRMISSRPVFLRQLTCCHSFLKNGSLIGLSSRTQRHTCCLISQPNDVPRATASMWQVCKVRDSLMKVCTIFH